MPVFPATSIMASLANQPWFPVTKLESLPPQCAPDKRTLHTAEDAADDKWVCQLWVSSSLPQRQLAKGELPPALKKATRGGGGTRKR